MADESNQTEGSAEGAQVLSLLPSERTVRRARAVDQAFEQRRSSEQKPELFEDRIGSSTGLDAYYAIKRRGMGDALQALGALRSEQIQTLFDLELWKSDTVEISDFFSWIEGFRESGPEAVVRAARALDMEALAAILRRRLLIASVPKDDRSDNEPLPDWVRYPPEGIEPLGQTPDGRFLVAARLTDELYDLAEEGDPWIDEEERKQVMALVRDLYLDNGWEYAASVLRLAQVDMTFALEDSAYRFRNGRIEDLGFPPFEQAMEIYAPLEAHVLKDKDGCADVSVDSEGRLPLMHVETLYHGLLAKSLNRVEPIVASRIEADLLAVMNSTLVADRIDPADLDAVREALERVRGYINIALGYKPAEVSVDSEAEHRLRTHHVSTLSRVGYTLTLRLSHRVRRLLNHEGLGGLGLSALNAAETAKAEALLLKRPLFNAEKPFENVIDYQHAERFVETLELLAEFSKEAGLFAFELGSNVLPTDERERDLDTRLVSGAFHMMLGHEFRIDGLREEELVELLDRLGASSCAGSFEDGPTIARTLAERFSQGNRFIADYIESLLNKMAVLLFPLVGSERVDLRFVEGVLRVRAHAETQSRA